MSASCLICSHDLKAIYGKNVNQPQYIASIVKLLNLLVCLRLVDEKSLKMDHLFQIPEIFTKRSWSLAHLKKGEKISL